MGNTLANIFDYSRHKFHSAAGSGRLFLGRVFWLEKEEVDKEI